MYVSSYIEFLVNGELQSLAVKDVGDLDPNTTDIITDTQLVNRDKIRSYINLANLELHKRFNILKKTEQLEFALAGEEFKTPDDMLHVISCTFTDGTEIPINNEKISLDPSTGEDINYSVMFTDPEYIRIKGTDSKNRSTVLLTYAASPKLASTVRTKLRLPAVYTEALLNYAAYKAHAAVNGDIQAENNTYYMRFRESCAQIERSGLQNPDNCDTNLRLVENGFV